MFAKNWSFYEPIDPYYGALIASAISLKTRQVGGAYKGMQRFISGDLLKQTQIDNEPCFIFANEININVIDFIAEK